MQTDTKNCKRAKGGKQKGIGEKLTKEGKLHGRILEKSISKKAIRPLWNYKKNKKESANCQKIHPTSFYGKGKMMGPKVNELLGFQNPNSTGKKKNHHQTLSLCDATEPQLTTAGPEQ